MGLGVGVDVDFLLPGLERLARARSPPWLGAQVVKVYYDDSNCHRRTEVGILSAVVVVAVDDLSARLVFEHRIVQG